MTEERRWNRRVPLAVAIGAILALAASASAGITLTSTPDGLVQQGELTQIAWAETIRCNVNYGRVPGSYTNETAAWGWDSLVFTPEDEGMSSGVYYCIVSEIDGPLTSGEFVLIVDSPDAPSPTGPPNGSTVHATTTTLHWDPVENVPYYHVLVSDHEIDVAEEDGEIVVSGANIVWQAITSGTSIQYGSPDPSGYFVDSNGTSPPLMSGFDYRWLVFSNYGNNPLLSSTARAGLSSFGAEVPVSLGTPELASPADSVALTDDQVVFSWTPVPGSAGYHVYIYETREWSQAEASFPVWDGPSPTPSADVSLGSFLVSGTYTWRVVALDASGRGAASQTRGFEYSTETGTAKVRTKRLDGSRLGNVFVEMEFLDGGVNALPTVTDEIGFSDVELIPGDYAFHATKADYVDTTVTATIDAGEAPYVAINMRTAPARMRGVVRDEGGTPVFDADVFAVQGDEVLEAASDPSGNFVIEASTGIWAVHAERPGFAPSAAVEVELHADEYVELPGPLTLVVTPGVASGNVVNAAGNPVVGATVEAESSFGSSSAFTNSSGYFQLELAPGAWSITAHKSGFVPSVERTVTVAPEGTTPIDPPLVLTPAGSAVIGRVTDGRVNFADARVVAVPASGAVHETETNAFGEFVFTLPPDIYELRAQCDGHATSASHQVDLTSGGSYLGVELVVVPTSCDLSGVVRDGSVPVEGAVVADGDAETTTGAGGEFTLSVAPGLREVTAEKAGYLPGESLLVGAVSGGSLESLDLALTGGASSVSGTVMSGTEPVAGALVRASSSEREEVIEGVSDEFGAYALEIEAGLWDITAEKEGFFAPGSAEAVMVASGQSVFGVDPDVSVDCALLSGLIGDSRSSVSGAVVSLRRAQDGAEAARTTSDVSGRYLLAVAPNVAYTLVVDGPSHGTTELPVPALPAGEERTLDVVLEPREAGIAGTVSSGGRPVPGTLVETDGAASVTNAFGDYELHADAGLHDVTVTCPGYSDAVLTDVSVTSGENALLDIELASDHASVHGVVTDSGSSEPVDGALVTVVFDASVEDGGVSVVTGPDGAYYIDGVVAGESELIAVRRGYVTAVEEVALVELESGEHDVMLVRRTGSVSGHVSDYDTGLPLSGVSVRAREEGAIVSSDLTGSDGEYVIEGLDTSRAYSIHASRSGYSAASDNPIGDVMPDAVGIDFTLSESAGVITGVVLDGIDGSPLVGASVTADNDQGHFGSASSGADGSFEITELAGVGTYVVAASLFGYFEVEEPGVVPGGEPLTLALPRNFATLSGTLTAADGGVDLDESIVVATNIAFAQHSQTAVPGDTGDYEMAELRPGSYVLSVTGGGHLSTPSQRSLVVGEGEVVSGVDFTVERADIQRIEIEGPNELPAGGDASYSGSVFAQNDRLVDTDLEWWLAPECAGSAGRAGGEVHVADGYLGEVTISARDPESGISGHSAAAVFVTATPASGVAASDSTGMTLAVGPGALEDARRVYLVHESLPDAMRYSKGYVLGETAYYLKPRGLSFEMGYEPTISIPDATGRGQLVMWDHDHLTWIGLGSERLSGALESQIGELGRLALRSATGPLRVSDVRAEPNPFAPDSGPVLITYGISSNDARMPFVSVRVFNMAGAIVRELVSNEPQGSGVASVEWDGMTDDSEIARNGRYVVEVKAEDSSGSERALGTVVLIK